MYNVEAIRANFPIFSATKQKDRNHPLVFLDNASTTQKPAMVINAICDYYQNYTSNVHRGIYPIGNQATHTFEATRAKVARFVNAIDASEIIFTKGATEGINLVTQSFLKPMLKTGDEVVISAMEHHSNLVPWQMICQERGAVLRIISVDDQGNLPLAELENRLSDRTVMVGIVHISNTLGTINAIQSIGALLSARQIPFLVDAAQSVASYKVDVQQFGCTFLTASGHKMFGPTGIGFLYGKTKALKTMQPYQYCGEMIRVVDYHATTFADIPHKFEGGTPNIAGVIGLGAAIDFIQQLDYKAVQEHLEDLLNYGHQQLLKIQGLKIIGTSNHKSSIISFVLDGIHPHDLATFLGRKNICVRAGHHCTQPLMKRFGVPATVRASFSVYNTKAEIDQLVRAIKETQQFFGQPTL